MNSVEHFTEAERLFDQAEVDARDPMRKYAEDANLIAAARWASSPVPLPSGELSSSWRQR